MQVSGVETMASSSNDSAPGNKGSDDRTSMVPSIEVEVEVEDADEEGANEGKIREVPPPDWLFAWMWVNRQRALGHLPN